MNMISIKKIVMGLTLSAMVFGAKAQKVYNEGSIDYNIVVNGTSFDSKSYFKGDTSCLSFQRGPATIKMIGSAKGDFFNVLVDVPVANIKKAAIATPPEIDEALATDPQYAFTKTDETKKIGDYNCMKYIAKNAKTGTSYDLWMTTDITVPPNLLTKLYAGITGTPVLFTYLQGGTTAEVVTLKAINDTKVPADTFQIPTGYDKVSLTDLQKMGGRRQ